MNSRLSLSAVGHSTSLIFLISFMLYVGFDFVFPEQAMFQAWLLVMEVSLTLMLAGYVFLSKGWCQVHGNYANIQLAKQEEQYFHGQFGEAFGFGSYIALVWVPIYNFTVSHQPAQKYS